jgi:hypothetical protein
VAQSGQSDGWDDEYFMGGLPSSCAGVCAVPDQGTSGGAGFCATFGKYPII